MQEPRTFCRAVMHEYERQWGRGGGHAVRHPLQLKMRSLQSWCDEACSADDFESRLEQAQQSSELGEALLAEETQALAAGRGGDDRVSLAFEEVAQEESGLRIGVDDQDRVLLAHPSSLSPPGSQHTVLEEHEHQPRDLHADENRQAAQAPDPDMRSVLADGSEETDHSERGRVVCGEQAVRQRQAAGEAPEHVHREPSGGDGHADRGARPGFPEEPGDRDGDDAEDEECAQCGERPPGHGMTFAPRPRPAMSVMSDTRALLAGV